MKLEQIKPTVEFLQSEILKLIQNVDLLSDKDKQIMFRNIEDLINQFGTEVIEFVEPELAKVYENELKLTTNELSKQGVSLSNELNSQVHQSALANITSDTMMDLQAALRQAYFTTVSTINQTLKEVQSDISRGILYGQNRRKIIQRVSDSFINGGMKSFRTIDNKLLPLDFYTETVVRTKLSNARTHAHVNHYLATDNDLVYVTGNLDTCSECAKYQDRVFSLTGKDKRFPQLDVRDVIPVHPNCKCSVRPFVADFKSESEINKYIAKGKDFNPNLDPRTKKQRESYERDQKLKRKARQEMKNYNSIKAILGDDAPKSLGAYRRMKRSNSTGYVKMKQKLRVARQEMKG
ncbi:phage minor capsid protein [Mammaliicoccus vitulinus]|uniref:phage minor capsid protein n=1 Tax=Mammaliicoccus vitulinus TaxID=71237 RepID=UPI0028D8EA15|nr:phage minor capsid protein [Mammaliicoccus vitulinus]